MRKFLFSFGLLTALTVMQLMASAAIASELVIGQINAQTGNGASLGKPLAFGAQIYVDRVNAAGGFKNRKVRLITLDDQFNEKMTGELAEKLVADNNVVALINTLGAPNIDNLISSGFLNQHRISVIGPLTNSSTARDRNSPHVFFVRAGLREEVNAMVKQVEILGFKKIGIFYQNDTSGLDGVKMITDALASKGLMPLVKASYERQDFKADQASKIFREAKPDVILTISIAAATSQLVRNLGRSISSGVMIIANSGNSADVLVKDLGADLARGLAIVQVMPSVSNAALPVVKEFLQDFAKHAPAGSVANAMSLEGYLAAKVFFIAASRVKGGVNRQSLYAALGDMPPLDLGGYRVDFSDGKRLGSVYAEVAVLTGAGKLSR